MNPADLRGKAAAWAAGAARGVMGAARSTLARARVAVASTFRRAAGGDRKRQVVLAGSVGLALFLLAAIITVATSARGRREAMADAAPPAVLDFSVIEQLVMPGPEPGELPFPLERERKTRYTDADSAEYRPRYGSIDVSELARRRKAELAAVYQAVD